MMRQSTRIGKGKDSDHVPGIDKVRAALEM